MATETLGAPALEAQALIDALPAATLLVDASEQVAFANRAAHRLLGYNAGELHGNKINFLFSARGDEKTVSAHRQDGSTLRLHLSRGNITGTSHSVVTLQIVEDADKLPPCMIALTRLAMLGEMAGSVTHELNQPLSAIANYAQAVKWLLETPDYDRAEVTESLGEITAQAIRASGIIRRLRSLIQKGEAVGEPPREPVALDALLGEINDFLAAEARLKSVRLKLEIPAALPAVNIERIQIQQVMLSLVRNAIEAMAQLPREQREVQVSACLHGEHEVAVSVADCGPGLAPEMEPRLFQPFNSTRAGGAGLGLYISQTIVEAHEGALVYGPNEPRGARFSFRLPVAKGQ